MTWHADADLLDHYVAGTTDASHAMSVEAHLIGCVECRTGIASRSDHARLDRTWGALVDRIDLARRPWFERVLGALGMRDTTARLLAATPGLRLPFVMGAALVLSFAVLAGGAGRDLTAIGALLLVAPMLPVAGVALTYGPWADPAYEITKPTPLPAFRLLLVRSAVVLVVTTIFGAAAAMAVPGADWRVMGWLLPSLALTASTLALSTWLPLHTAAAALSGLWVAATLIGLRVVAAGARPRLSLMVEVAVFRPSGQVACAAIAFAAAAVAVRRRHLVETEAHA